MNTKPVAIVTAHELREWSRMATDAYRNGVNYIGHRYSAAAAIIPAGSAIPVSVFDSLQINYRKWLVNGISQFKE